jgi:hypothetical protein
MRTHITYVCYGHRKDPLGTTLGQYSLLPNTPDDVKKSVNDGIGDIVSFIECFVFPAIIYYFP